MKNLLLKMKRSFMALVIACTAAKAQQTALFNTYSYDLMQLNIAAAGRTCFEASMNYRNQWSGIKDAPKLYQLNAGLALGKSNGIGIRVAQQSMGLFRVSNTTLGYAYRVKFSETTKLHLGLGAAWQQNLFAADKAIVLDNRDVSLGTGQAQQRSNNFDAEAGALFLSDRLTAGVSALHLYNTNSRLESAAYKVKPQLNIVLAYKFNKGRPVEIEPWLVNRYTVNGINQPEGILNIRLRQVITIGAGYRLNYGYLALAGCDLGKFKVAYSFDYGAGKHAGAYGASHQVLLGFNLCKAKTKKQEPVAESPAPAKQEPVLIKAAPVQAEPVKEAPVKEEEPVFTRSEVKPAPVADAPKKDLAAERLRKQEAALKEINALCDALVFEVNKTALPAGSSASLDKIAALIIENELQVKVKGYASKDGNPAVNARLTRLRAEYVRAELIKRGVDPAVITAGGVSNGEALFDGTGTALKEKNRTVRIINIKQDI